METTYDGLMETLFQETKQAEDKLQQLINHGLHGSVLMETTKAGYDSLYHSLEKAGIDSIYEKWKESGTLDRTIWKADADNNMDEAVLSFIYRFMTCHGTDSSNLENMRATFRNGYCYYFACMLKEAFARGEVCIAAPFGHFVWVDTDGMPYDIEGAYCGEAELFIPASRLGRMVDDFLHVDGKGYCATKEEIQNLMDSYRKELAEKE